MKKCITPRIEVYAVEYRHKTDRAKRKGKNHSFAEINREKPSRIVLGKRVAAKRF